MNHTELNTLLQAMRNPNKRNWILMVPNSLGETVVVCGFGKSFIEKHGHGITLVIPESHSFIAKCFPDTFDRIITIPLGVMRQFSETGFIPPNFFQVDFPINTWPAQNGDCRAAALHDLWIETVGRAGLDFLKLYRYVLRLDWNVKFSQAVVPSSSYDEAKKFININKIINKRSVILFIGANTQRPAPIYFWEKLIDLYHESGFHVIINKFGSMLTPGEIKSKKALIVDLPLEIAIPVCEYAGHLVCGGNGFVTLALACKIDCNMDILLTDERCCDYGKLLYEDIPCMSACQQLNIAELVNNKGWFREWMVGKKSDIHHYDAVARGIVYNTSNELAIVKI